MAQHKLSQPGLMAQALRLSTSKALGPTQITIMSMHAQTHACAALCVRALRARMRAFWWTL